MENTPSTNDKKQASIIEFLIVVVFVAVLMKLLASVFFEQEANVTDIAFVGLAQNFTTKLNVVHGQWMMDRQPKIVVINSLNSAEQEAIFVNRAGWIDSEFSVLACQKIWQQALAVPLHVANSPITAIEIQNISINNGRLCRYSIANGQSFDYRSDIGKIQQQK